MRMRLLRLALVWEVCVAEENALEQEDSTTTRPCTDAGGTVSLLACGDVCVGPNNLRGFRANASSGWVMAQGEDSARTVPCGLCRQAR